ncbi:MAG: SpvB/TcaC N-terminal domain-containing protein, partial [Pseudomonadota bacterium]
MTQNIPSLPSSGASAQGLSSNFQPDLSSGTGNYSIALDLPRGPRGFRPELALSYSSGAGQGSFGQGWALTGLMTIHVSTRKGVPDPAHPDARVYTLGGGNELVCVADLPSGHKIYRPQTDNHNWHILRSGDAWTVTTSDGTRYRFGTSDNSRVADPDSGEIMEWHLSELVNPTGQVASFRYLAFGPGRSIVEIAYGPFSVDFQYEPRPDQFTNARYGFPIARDARCHAIDIRSERSPHAILRSYRLGYLECRHTQVSQLGQIEQASDVADDALAFPTLSFRYSDWTNEDVTLRRLSFDGEVPPPPSSAAAAALDLEGRGLPGILEGAGTEWRFWRNLGAGGFAAPTNLSNAPNGLGLGTGGVAILDLEGNGTADLLQISESAQGFFPNAAGGAFETFVDYGAMPPIRIGDSSVRFVDIDGDGVVDAIKSEPDAFLLFQNNGKGGWSDAPLRIPRIFDRDVFPDVDLSSNTVFFADMSGDGLPDIVELRAFETVYWPYLGHGRWGRKVTMIGQPAFPGGFDSGRARLLDVDGDGLS